MRADLDGSGCVDVADIVAVTTHATGAAPNVLAAYGDPTPMVVNSTGDQFDANVNNGICDTSAGTCTLRAAIIQANANPGPDIIHFNIAGSGPHQINLTDRLPTINDQSGPVTIDGYTDQAPRRTPPPECRTPRS